VEPGRRQRPAGHRPVPWLPSDAPSTAIPTPGPGEPAPGHRRPSDIMQAACSASRTTPAHCLRHETLWPALSPCDRAELTQRARSAQLCPPYCSTTTRQPTWPRRRRWPGSPRTWCCPGTARPTAAAQSALSSGPWPRTAERPAAAPDPLAAVGYRVVCTGCISVKYLAAASSVVPHLVADA
jgi:hypothetical protein